MRLKNFFAGILAFCTLLGAMSFQGIVTGVADGTDNGDMRDDMTAQDYADDMGLGINLGNTMEAYYLDGKIREGNWLEEGRIDSGAQIIGNNSPKNYEKCWGAVETTQECIDGMKKAGFNTVRIPVYWGNMMEENGTFTINPEYIGRVKEIVDYCRNAGVYTIINIHHYDEFLIRRYLEAGSLEECAETFKKLWTQIAEYFKKYSDYLMFEGFNEYLGGGPYDRDEFGNVKTDEWGNVKVKDLPKDEAYKWTNTLNQTFVDAVRNTGENNEKRVLIVSGYWTNIDNTTQDDFKIPEDNTKDRLMVSVHYVDNNMYWSNQIGSKNWINYSKGQLEELKNAFTKRNIPVFIGETTSIYPSDKFSSNAILYESYTALDYMLRLIKSYGFVPVLWDVNDGFYSRTQCKIKAKANSEVIEILADELAQGKFTPPETPTRPTAPDDTSDSNAGSSSNSGGTTPEKTTPTQAPSSTPSTGKVTVAKPAKVVKVKLKAKKKKLNVSWKKVKGATGYEVKAATNNKFTKNKKKVTVKKNKVTLKGLKSKKKYYVKVRAFKTVKGEKRCGKWSNVVKKKVK